MHIADIKLRIIGGKTSFFNHKTLWIMFFSFVLIAKFTGSIRVNFSDKIALASHMLTVWKYVLHTITSEWC